MLLNFAKISLTKSKTIFRPLNLISFKNNQDTVIYLKPNRKIACNHKITIRKVFIWNSPLRLDLKALIIIKQKCATDYHRWDPTVSLLRKSSLLACYLTLKRCFIKLAAIFINKYLTLLDMLCLILFFLSLKF
ncbi:hypothetical protein BpHYR1_043934 [Brachionus plicatilis]|uniref:Uncharacterized protein n=1 Tax=Brachionus plicatilis TaxID=10195 RepID=A0A3M7RJJ1_BRAPC|nr:hypothetical protein BpHYR1_043934 [Brachionus plicatilis]